MYRLTSQERKQWLKAAVFSESKRNLGITQGESIAAVKETKKPQHCIVKRPKLSNNVFLETKAYPEFMRRHKSSLLVVSPTQCGKTWGWKNSHYGSYSLREQETEANIGVLKSVAG